MHLSENEKSVPAGAHVTERLKKTMGYLKLSAKWHKESAEVSYKDELNSPYHLDVPAAEIVTRLRK
jgi:hypothetical protein